MKGPRGPSITVKKYSNRRLYDTAESRYITLDELAEKIRAGARVEVVDAKSGDDLTQATLAQIILESRRAARLLPVPLLVQLIRMGDDALSEFFSSYMSWALDFYLQAKKSAEAMSPFNPFATLPFSGAAAFSELMARAPWTTGRPKAEAARPPSAPEGEPPPEPGFEDDAEGAAVPALEDIAELRREVEALKKALASRS